MPDSAPLPRDVSRLLAWIEAATPGTLIPACELAERIQSLPVAGGTGGGPAAVDHGEPEQLLTADQVADWLNMNVQSVYRLGREGHLKRVKLADNTVRFRRSDVEQCIERRTG